MISDIQNALLTWFTQNKRDLPWRREPRDPYHVWLSEIMLQQTQVITVIPYFERWLARFPRLVDLANANQDEVLKLWEGLGYYSRARNLHTAAQKVQNEGNGQIPNDVPGLLALPGIGRYTAGAIASLAFGRDAAILDGNVKRVISRLYALPAASDDELWQHSEALVPTGQAGKFNEALMDLGATICTPRVPRCHSCPLHLNCSAYAKLNPEGYPAPKEKKPIPHKDLVTLVCRNRAGQFLMRQRPRSGLLGGLWEFPNEEIVGIPVPLPTKSPQQPALIDAPSPILGLGLGLMRQLVNTDIATPPDHIGQVKHAFTHFRITRHVVFADDVAPTLQLDAHNWVSPSEIDKLALTKSDQRILTLCQANIKKRT
ncbi:MAG: A/G-specific adenine glycosylase [Anaerolineae bacterium]|nr:A/G-specific adenine glycosylase [Anaerolineae bacterium]